MRSVVIHLQVRVLSSIAVASRAPHLALFIMYIVAMWGAKPNHVIYVVKQLKCFQIYRLLESAGYLRLPFLHLAGNRSIC